MNNKLLRQKVESLIKNKVATDYQISKATGLTLSPVQRIRRGEVNLDNITLLTAEKLADFEDDFKPE